MTKNPSRSSETDDTVLVEVQDTSAGVGVQDTSAPTSRGAGTVVDTGHILYTDLSVRRPD